MELKLIKTTGGGDGRPPKCKCGADGFVRQGHGWACVSCALYYPSDFQTLSSGLGRLVQFVKEDSNGKNSKGH